jgi:hypothetical protein
VGAGIEINIDRSTLSLSGGRRIVAFCDCDIALRHAKSVAAAKDISTSEEWSPTSLLLCTHVRSIPGVCRCAHGADILGGITMSTGEEIQYEIRADASQMRSEFAKVKSSLSDVKNKTKETELSLNSFGKSLGKFGTLIKGLFAAMLVRTAIQFAEFAGRVDSVSQAFYNLTGKSRAASDALVQSISEAANGTMSNLDIMQSSSLALQLMGEKVADQLPQMARIALASARQQARTPASFIMISSWQPAASLL